MVNFGKFVLPLFLWAGWQAHAQTLTLKGHCETGSAEEMGLHVKALGPSAPKAVKLTVKQADFEGEVSASPSGFYTIYGRNGNSQLIIPLYFPESGKEYKLKLRIENGCPMVDAGKDNKALSAFNALTYVKGRYFWMYGGELALDRVDDFLTHYHVAADSIAKRYRCSEAVRQYLKLWAYVSVSTYYESIPQVTGKSLAEMPFKRSDVMESPEKILDTDMASFFSTSSYIIFRSLPKGTLSEQLAYLEARYTNGEVRKNVGNMILDNFIRNFDFSGDYEAGLAELSASVTKYDLDKSYVENFEKRKSSVKGTAFPSGVVLVDAEGNKVDFSTFKGRYVYIDLWASWCGPCVNEVPHLQKLEKELANKDVVFVSISLDKNEKAWKSKMKALNMHGHQLLNMDNSLAEALNVKGIPFFIIYDKEGFLYKSNAPRPSDPSLKALLEKLH